MKYPTIEIDTSVEIDEYLKGRMLDVLTALNLDEASMSLYLEACEDGRELSDAASCLGQAILNGMFIEAISEGMKIKEG